MSNETEQEQLRQLLISCFKAAVEYVSEYEEGLTQNQALAIDSIEEHDEGFEAVLGVMVEEAKISDQIEEATEFYQEFLNAIQGKSGDAEQRTYSVRMLEEYRLNFRS